MSEWFRSLCDDLYLDMCVNTELDLPSSRDTVLTFFERIQKQYPTMRNFFRRGENEYCLEESQSAGNYRWVALEIDRLVCGCMNPQEFSDAYQQHKLVLDLAPYMLSLSPLEVESLDVTFAMEFKCSDSHEEVISEALFSDSVYNSFSDVPGTRIIGMSPEFVLALTEDAYTQARISVESKTAIGDPRRPKENSGQAIGLSLTVRQYPNADRKFELIESFENQWKITEEIIAEKLVPCFAKPLINVITQRRLSHP